VIGFLEGMNNTTAIFLSLCTIEALGAHWRHHVFNNIGFTSYLIINMRHPSNVKTIVLVE
jgi:hypothetical protein